MSPSERVRALLDDAALPADDRVGVVLSMIEALGEGPAPEPSAELAALLAGATPVADRAEVEPEAPPRSLGRRLVGGAGALAVAVVAGTGVAAAANELPRVAQHVAAGVSERLLPFTFPQPPAPLVHGSGRVPVPQHDMSAPAGPDGAGGGRWPGAGPVAGHDVLRPGPGAGARSSGAEHHHDPDGGRSGDGDGWSAASTDDQGGWADRDGADGSRDDGSGAGGSRDGGDDAEGTGGSSDGDASGGGDERDPDDGSGDGDGGSYGTADGGSYDDGGSSYDTGSTGSSYDGSR